MLNNLKCELCGNEIVNGSHKTVYDINNHEELVVCIECVRGNYDTICESLYVNSSEFHFCDECERCFHENDLVENENGYFCEECNDMLNGIPHYHSHNYNEFLTTDKDNENTTLFGVELEVECDEEFTPKSVYENVEDIIEDEFYVEKDSSLINGFEIISKPFSYNYMVENLEDTFKELTKKLQYQINNKATSNGIHIHMTKKNYQHEVYMVALTEYYQKELTIISNREGKQLKRWAKFLFEKEDKDLLNLRMIENEMDNYRYFACNTSNTNTIEIRIFKSTNDYKMILGYVEIVANMCAYALENKIEEDLSNMPSFIEIATYKYNNGYAEYVLNNFGMLSKATC